MGYRWQPEGNKAEGAEAEGGEEAMNDSKVSLGDVPTGKDAVLDCGCVVGRVMGGEPAFARIEFIEIAKDCQAHTLADMHRQVNWGLKTPHVLPIELRVRHVLSKG